ncbi:MAG: GNAT family N-acetyltransferase [Pseudomonadota bacterium]
MSAPFAMPSTLESERLRLVPWHQRHFEDVYRFNADQEATRFVGGVMTRAEASRAFMTVPGHWALRGYGIYAVERKDGTFVGGCGLYYPHGWPELELGYDQLPEHQGHGYITEAARAVIDEAGRRGLTRLVSLIHPENARSIRVAERLGAVKERTFDLLQPGNPVVCYRHQLRGAAA